MTFEKLGPKAGDWSVNEEAVEDASVVESSPFFASSDFS
jgi:hypothetical protein